MESGNIKWHGVMKVRHGGCLSMPDFDFIFLAKKISAHESGKNGRLYFI